MFVQHQSKPIRLNSPLSAPSRSGQWNCRWFFRLAIDENSIEHAPHVNLLLISSSNLSCENVWQSISHFMRNSFSQRSHLYKILSLCTFSKCRKSRDVEINSLSQYSHSITSCCIHTCRLIPSVSMSSRHTVHFCTLFKYCLGRWFKRRCRSSVSGCSKHSLHVPHWYAGITNGMVNHLVNFISVFDCTTYV